MRSILLPGGIGYIGSHTVLALLPLIKAHPVVIQIFDNLSNSTEAILPTLQAIAVAQLGYTPELFREKVRFQKGDILSKPFLEGLFARLATECPVDTVIHFAARKAVGESVEQPLLYFETNVVGTLNLLQCVQRHKVPHFIFSSSASVYGNGKECTEESPLGALSPYGDTKHMVELMMKAMGQCRPESSFLALRYFNPVGAHHSGKIGDMPLQPNNLFPVIEQVVLGKRPELKIFGNDYDTPDGTGVRDYIHIEDLAEGHAAAYRSIASLRGYNVINLGTGTGSSVLQVVQLYQKVNQIKIPHQITARRPGDVGKLVALVGRAKELLGWECRRGLDQACEDSYRFIMKQD